MINECKKLGMKPLCNHPSYCKTDAASIYIGQSHHIAYPPHRDNNSYFPAGWAAVRDNMLYSVGDPFCVYSAKANGRNALCQVGNSHAWKVPAQGLRYVCVKRNVSADAVYR